MAQSDAASSFRYHKGMRIGASEDAESRLGHEQLVQAVIDLGTSRAKPSMAAVGKGKKYRTASGNQMKSLATETAANFQCGAIDLISLRQVCPPIAEAVEEFMTFLGKIKLEISRESDDARLIGIEKAARFLDVSDDSIYRKIKRGTLEARWQGRRPYFTLAELRRHIDALPRKPESKGSTGRD